MELFDVSILNGLSYGLLLFLLSAGLTLVFSMMGVVNFAHASFYMVGAYLAYSMSRWIGFWLALVIAPLLTGLLGACFERVVLRRAHRHGHVAELLVTFGLAYVAVELVQLLWGRQPLDFQPPPVLKGPAFTLVNDAASGMRLVWGAADASLCSGPGVSCSPFPATRAFMMLASLAMVLALAVLWLRSRVGTVVQAALENPAMLGALGHDVDRLFMMVFGAGSALAGLAGVIGGSTFVTEPAMAGAVGSVVFVVVVVGGLGSLAGAFIASLALGLLQTFAVAFDVSVASLSARVGWDVSSWAASQGWLTVTSSQVAPLLPYALLVLTLIVRPAGLLGSRET